MGCCDAAADDVKEAEAEGCAALRGGVPLAMEGASVAARLRGESATLAPFRLVGKTSLLL